MKSPGFNSMRDTVDMYGDWYGVHKDAQATVRSLWNTTCSVCSFGLSCRVKYIVNACGHQKGSCRTVEP